jgi:hypothetical protein
LSSSRLSLITGALFVWGALTRIAALLDNASLNGDEAMLGLNIGRRTFAQLLQPLDYGQVAPVPFLWAERVAVLVGGVTATALRIVPLLAGVGLLWALYRLADRLIGRLEAVVALALAATAFPLIRYSVEVKPYIVDALACTILVWVAARLAEDLNDRRRWLWLTIVGAFSVFVSTPALLTCGAVVGGLTVTAVRARKLRSLAGLCALGVLWITIFALTYAAWYAPNAGAPYMRDFWAEAFLRPGTPHLLARFWRGLDETACTLTCWRGVVDLTPVLILLAALGLVELWRRRGPDYAVLVVGPIAAAFGASALGQYPIASRLMLYAAPLLAIMVATGLVALAGHIEQRWARVRARWVLMSFLYPSLIVTAVLTFDWGIQGEEVRPLAEDYRLRGSQEPIYVFARAVPAWVFHTTDWTRADTARLTWVARMSGPQGPGFGNGGSRGRRAQGEGVGLIYAHEGHMELFGTPSGAQGRVGTGYASPTPDPGWAESEAWRIRESARPYAWVVMSDFVHPPLDERGALIAAVRDAGGEAVYSKETADAVLYRVRFRSHSTD